MTITKQDLQTHAPKGPLSKVKAAREILRERAVELIESYIALAAEAQAAGERDIAAEILWRLIDHIPKDELQGIIDGPSSKPVESTQPNRPYVQIGIALGGVNTPKELPAVSVIDVDPHE